MKATVVTLSIIGLLIFLIGSIFIGTYNHMVSLDNQVDQSWANIESQLQRRADLLPNLTKSTRGLLKQELAVIQAAADRFKTSPSGSAQQVEAASQLQGGFSEFMGRLLVIQEQYPEIKTDKTVQSLMDELTGTENRINYARTEYNGAVAQYNQTIRTFPGNFLAGMFGFEKRTFFEAEEGAETPPTVDLEFDDEKTIPFNNSTGNDAGPSGMLNGNSTN